MFRNKRHINARNDEWIHVHRNGPRSNNWDLPQVIGTGVGLLILAALVWELIKATYPFLIVAGVIVAIVHFKKKS
ncbi:MAG: hypothetical protein NTY01_04905 [Verrucomicrobia bacterium]|nr:hypothetical protein [Verrucomicrobiota bacterium]